MFFIYCTSQRAFSRALALWIGRLCFKPQYCFFPSTDYSSEKWCRDYFLSCSALRMAEIIRAELVEIMKRIELPSSEPAFGSEENILSVKKSLLAGYFMHVRKKYCGFILLHECFQRTSAGWWNLLIITKSHFFHSISSPSAHSNLLSGVQLSQHEVHTGRELSICFSLKELFNLFKPFNL